MTTLVPLNYHFRPHQILLTITFGCFNPSRQSYSVASISSNNHIRFPQSLLTILFFPKTRRFLLRNIYLATLAVKSQRIFQMKIYLQELTYQTQCFKGHFFPLVRYCCAISSCFCHEI